MMMIDFVAMLVLLHYQAYISNSLEHTPNECAVCWSTDERVTGQLDSLQMMRRLFMS